MPITSSFDDLSASLRLEGEIDANVSHELKEVLSAALSSQRRDLLCDLAGVSMLDITAVQLLLSARREAHLAGITFVLSDVPANLEQSLADAGLGQLFKSGQEVLDPQETSDDRPI